MRPLPRALATTATAAALLSVAACGGNPTPAPPPKATASPSTTASPSATPPALPAAAKEKTEAGAIAATRHFISALNFAGATGDTSALRATYVASCTRCAAIADGIEKTYEQGGSYEGGDWRTEGVKFYDIEGDLAILDTNIAYQEQTWIEKRGAKPVRYKASKNHLHAFQLKWKGSDGWRVGALDPTA